MDAFWALIYVFSTGGSRGDEPDGATIVIGVLCILGALSLLSLSQKPKV